jgi:tRNA G18 (ribose-2'-O)-methylase SpoU
VIIEIDDPHDGRLVAFRWRERQLASKPQRLEKVGAGLFVAEGDLVVDRAITARHTPVALLCSTRRATELETLVAPEVPVYQASSDVRREITGLGVPLEATGLFQRPPLREPGELISASSCLVVLEAVDNPTNIGAIIRSASALGWDGVLLDPTSADPLARRALRVSMGAGLSLPFARVESIQSLSDLLAHYCVTTYALTPDSKAVDISLLPTDEGSKRALLFGSEREGLSSVLLQNAQHKARIPMHHGVDSLNVGAAAAIAMYVLGPRHS